MYFMGTTCSRGTYFFYSRQHNGWIVADLDTGKAKLYNQLAIIKIHSEYCDLFDALEARAGLGQDDSRRWLVNGDDLVILLRDYAQDMEVLMVYYQDGSEKPYGEAEKQLAQIAAKVKKRRKGKDT